MGWTVHTRAPDRPDGAGSEIGAVPDPPISDPAGRDTVGAGTPRRGSGRFELWWSGPVLAWETMRRRTRRQRAVAVAFAVVGVQILLRWVPWPYWWAGPIAVAVSCALLACSLVVPRLPAPRRADRQTVLRCLGATASIGTIAVVVAVVVGAAPAWVVPAVLVLLAGALAPLEPAARWLSVLVRPARGANSHLRSDGRPKVAYATSSAAAAAAARYQQDRGEAMSSYRCARCRAWHIGHTTRPARRR